MTLVRRLGWGLAALLLFVVAAFASMVRITVQSDPPQPVAAPITTTPGEALPQQRALSGLIIPVEGVPARQLSDTWGQSRGGGAREHHAIDIMAPKGTRVLAAAPGTVEKLFESVNGGHTIYVRSADRAAVYYYAHLDSYGVGERQRVVQGQPIATVGDTGSAAGGAPHLHFEIKLMRPGEGWWQGTNVNPYPLLASALTGEREGCLPLCPQIAKAPAFALSQANRSRSHEDQRRGHPSRQHHRI